MEIKTFLIQDQAGNIVPYPTAYVYQPGTDTLVSGLKKADGTALDNPFTGGAGGEVVFAAADGAYDLRIVAAGRDYTQRVQFLDATAVNETLAKKSNAAALGVDASDENMGSYSGTVLVANKTAKENIQALGSRASLDVFVTDTMFGAVGDNSTDCLAAFNAAIAYAKANGNRRIRIPRGNYTLSGAWVIDFPLDVDMDPSANLRFTNASSAGIMLDFRASSSNFGLNNIRLGGIYSPAITSSFAFPGYPSSWTSATRSSQDAITLKGGSRINIEVQYVIGWNAEFRPQGTYDATNGARAPMNINYKCNTGDLNTYGVYFDGGPSNAGYLGAIYCEWNTLFAKFPVYYGAATHSISQCNVRVTGQCFSNEAGGVIVYGEGAMVNTCDIDIVWAFAGYSNSDSPTGTSSTLTLPLLAGSSTSNGQTTDGNASVGYFGGSNNHIRIGQAVDLASYPGGALPASGNVTRIRNVGANNAITVGLYEQTQGSPVALSQTQGEANYGGGVGAASISKRTLISVAVPSMPATSTQTFYGYFCLLSNGQQKPIRLVSTDGSDLNSKLFFAAKDNTVSVNREMVLTVTNLSGATVAAATYYFWVIID